MIIYFGSKKHRITKALFSSRSEHLSYDKKQRRSIMLNLANIKQFLNKFNKRKLIKIRNIVDELLNQ